MYRQDRLMSEVGLVLASGLCGSARGMSDGANLHYNSQLYKYLPPGQILSRGGSPTIMCAASLHACDVFETFWALQCLQCLPVASAVLQQLAVRCLLLGQIFQPHTMSDGTMHMLLTCLSCPLSHSCHSAEGKTLCLPYGIT